MEAEFKCATTLFELTTYEVPEDECAELDDPLGSLGGKKSDLLLPADRMFRRNLLSILNWPESKFTFSPSLFDWATCLAIKLLFDSSTGKCTVETSANKEQRIKVMKVQVKCFKNVQATTTLLTE